MIVYLDKLETSKDKLLGVINTMETNMTTGKPLALMLRFMLPLLLGNVFQQLYNMIDTIIVGRYVGGDALAAVGSTGTIFFLVWGLCNGMSTGFTVLTSQCYGADDEDGTKLSVTNGIFLSIIVIAVMTAITLVLMDNILVWMNTPSDIYTDAYDYITAICKGLIATVAFNLFSSYLRAIGNSRMPLVSLVVSAIANILLDLLFIIVFHWGVAGAAWATVIAQGISAVLCIVYIWVKIDSLRPSLRHWRLHKPSIKRQLNIGIPMALQFGITASGTMVMQAAVNRFGSVAVTGFTAAGRVMNLLTQGMMSIGQTCASFSGQNYGHGDIDRVHQGTKDAMKIGTIYSVVVGVIALPILPYIIQLFFDKGVDIAPYMPWARPYFYMCVAGFIPLCMIFIYRNTIQGCGYGFAAMTLGIVELFARLGAAWISIRYESFIWAAAADPVAWLSAGLFAFFLYLGLRKKMMRGENQ